MRAIEAVLAALMVLILWPAVLAAGLYAAVKTGRLEYIRED